MVLSIDGNLAYVAVRTGPGVTLKQAIADLPQATEAARKACFERWEKAILAEEEEGGEAEADGAEGDAEGAQGETS